MRKLIIKVSTNKIRSTVERTVEIDESDMHDNDLIDEIVNETVNEMIYVEYEIE